MNESYPVDALLEALTEAERSAENSASQLNPNAPARHFCRGKANGMREAWEIVLRFREPVPAVTRFRDRGAKQPQTCGSCGQWILCDRMTGTFCGCGPRKDTEKGSEQ